MRFFKKTILLPIYLILSSTVFLSVKIHPALFWPSIFLGYLIPIFIVLNSVIAIWLFYLRKIMFILIAIFLIASTLPFYKKTFSYSFEKPLKKGHSLLSYNTKLFRKTGVYNQFSVKKIQWAVKDSSSIKCFQEYSTNHNWPLLDVTKQMQKEGYYSNVFKGKMKGKSPQNPGMAIFSKHPIINSGVVEGYENGFNATIFSDIDLGTDTIRIYNVHLASYKLDEVNKVNTLFHKINTLRKVIINTVEKHTDEINHLFNHVKQCNYPCLVVGDFNETPYSYNYFLMNSFYNAFEQNGSGFGFTLARSPRFLRIDNVFYDEKINMGAFKVDYTNELSDHYPLMCSFDLR